MQTIPLISSLTMHGVPELIRRELGNTVLARANAAAGFDLELLEGRNFFIPHVSVMSLVGTAAQAAGTANFGLMMARHMDVVTYGRWGDYVLGAETLHAAIRRCIAALPYHSTGDQMALSIRGGEARYRYRFALARQPGYENIAGLAAGVLNSLCKAYCSGMWHPIRIELDIPKPSRTAPFEDVFKCPVIFDAPVMAVVFDARHLAARGGKTAQRDVTTIDDLVRDRHGKAPRDLTASIAEQIRVLLAGNGNVEIDTIARLADVSTRTLQRELNRDGCDYRTVLNAVRIQRAAELLRGTATPITTIATELRYNAPGNFSRRFRQATGQTPSEYRRRSSAPDREPLEG